MCGCEYVDDEHVEPGKSEEAGEQVIDHMFESFNRLHIGSYENEETGSRSRSRYGTIRKSGAGGQYVDPPVARGKLHRMLRS